MISLYQHSVVYRRLITLTKPRSLLELKPRIACEMSAALAEYRQHPPFHFHESG